MMTSSILQLRWITLFFLLLNTSEIYASPSTRLETRQVIVRRKALKNFELKAPVAVPTSSPCEILLFEHTFGSSYNQPKQAAYSPPQECGKVGEWASVVFNVTASSIGVQYDRLAVLYLNDVEIWRTSTAEPGRVGIQWTVTKDVTKYMPLLSQPNGKLRLSLDNFLDPKNGLTGKFEMTVSAKFYPATKEFPKAKSADKIINIGNTLGSNLTNKITLPKNIESAFVELYASGSGPDEFWYANPPDEYLPILYKDPKPEDGKGSFREVQLWIDGKLAGAVYPFPVLYTGAISPSFWRILAGIGAYDAPSFMIDITPFVPILSDGKPHTFYIVVVGQSKDILGWLFSGSIHVGLDPSGKQTNGKMDVYEVNSDTKTAPLPSSTYKPDLKTGFKYTITSSRKVLISSTVVTGTGGSKVVKFQQDFTYKNEQTWEDGGGTQSVIITAAGQTSSTHGTATTLMDRYSFPFSLQSKLSRDLVKKQTSSKNKLEHGYTRLLQLPFPSDLIEKEIKTAQTSDGFITVDDQHHIVGGTSGTSQTYNFKDSRGNTYNRDIIVTNSTRISADHQSGTLVPKSTPQSSLFDQSLALQSVEDSENIDSHQNVEETINGLTVRFPRSHDRSL